MEKMGETTLVRTRYFASLSSEMKLNDKILKQYGSIKQELPTVCLQMRAKEVYLTWYKLANCYNMSFFTGPEHVLD